jgi:glucosylceramidase
MEMPAATQVEVVGALGPHLRQAGLTTAVLAYDHNWAQHPADTSALAPGADPEHDYALRVLGSAVGGQVRGTAFHCYYGDASAQEQVRAAAPDKEIWVTECSGSHGATDGPAKIFHDTLLWQSRHLTTASLRHWATSVQTWNLALDPRGGPRSGGCETCTGVVTVDGTTVRPNAEYYVLGHAARFLPRGSVRVMSATSGPAVDHVAFTTPSGEVVVLANNPGSRSTTLTVVVGRQSWQVSLPARSTATVHVARG